MRVDIHAERDGAQALGHMTDNKNILISYISYSNNLHLLQNTLKSQFFSL